MRLQVATARLAISVFWRLEPLLSTHNVARRRVAVDQMIATICLALADNRQAHRPLLHLLGHQVGTKLREIRHDSGVLLADKLVDDRTLRVLKPAEKGLVRRHALREEHRTAARAIAADIRAANLAALVEDARVNVLEALLVPSPFFGTKTFTLFSILLCLAGCRAPPELVGRRRAAFADVLHARSPS